MKNKIKLGIFAAGLTFFSPMLATGGSLNSEETLARVNQYLSDYYTVDKARHIANYVEDEDLLFKISMAFANSGNPSNAVHYAKRLSDPDRKYEIAETIIRRENPKNGRDLISTLPKEYIEKGVELLIEEGHPKNAEILNSYKPLK
jgi:hypothetical protein